MSASTSARTEVRSLPVITITSSNYVEALYEGQVTAQGYPKPMVSIQNFIGCVSMLILGNEEIIMMYNPGNSNVREYDTCIPNINTTECARFCCCQTRWQLPHEARYNVFINYV